MTSWILATAVAWPLLLGVALAGHVTVGPRPWSAVVYLAASRVCHQRPDRSFHLASVPWPVCGRCAGGYLGGMAIVPFASALSRRLRRRVVTTLAAACVPSALTIAAEWAGAPVSNELRALAAVPAGAAIVVALVSALGAGTSEAIG